MTTLILHAQVPDSDASCAQNQVWIEPIWGQTDKPLHQSFRCLTERFPITPKKKTDFKLACLKTFGSVEHFPTHLQRFCSSLRIHPICQICHAETKLQTAVKPQTLLQRQQCETRPLNQTTRLVQQTSDYSSAWQVPTTGPGTLGSDASRADWAKIKANTTLDVLT